MPCANVAAANAVVIGHRTVLTASLDVTRRQHG